MTKSTLVRACPRVGRNRSPRRCRSVASAREWQDRRHESTIRRERRGRRGCCPASSRPPTRSTSATTSARCGSGWRCRRRTRPSTAIVDLHAITVEHDPAAAARSAPGWPPPSCSRWASTRSVRRCSCSPHVPAHTQLSWVMECMTGFGEAGRMTQFKDKSARGGADRASVGPVHLPDPAGRGHPGLPGGRGAGRRGPAPAPRAHPQPGAAVQLPVRRRR